MDKIESLLDIYERLRNCSNPDEVEKLRKHLSKSHIQLKEVEKESGRELCKKDGSKKHGIPNTGKSRMLDEKKGELESLIKEAENLAEIGNFGDDLTMKAPEGIQVKFPTSNLVGENFERHMNEILDLLTKKNVSRIGVWGMGGVGKTTLVSHLHNMMLTQPDIYGFVYWITVSKDCSIEKLQNDIAKRIGESIPKKVDKSQRAGLLAEALKKKKKFVLILDDMWSHYDFNKIGLESSKEIGYRMIVTSRSEKVCLKMRCEPIIKVEPLSPKDAWTLFLENIGHQVPDDLTKISTDVLQECAGLPLGIITLAKSMIGCTDIYEWRNVLNELRSPSCKVDDMEDEVFKVLRLSYERLKDDQMKKCLLYCATYPEDYETDMNEDYEIEMDKLVWLFIDAGLLGKNDGLAKMFDRGLVVLKNLESAALLSIKCKFPHIINDRDVWKVIVLHDLIRDMALQIAGSRFMIKSGCGLTSIPDEESWTNELEVVSLMRNQIDEISDFAPKCSGLSILLLESDYSFGCLSDGFFRYLHGLKHLDLSWSRTTTLPNSISHLTNLTSLILRHCNELKSLPSLAKLTYLERIDLYCTKLRQWPEGMENLKKLRYLNLYLTTIERIRVGVIKKLTSLQYLAITDTFDVKELKCLNNLEHLTIFFENYKRFSEFITQMESNRRPSSYNFIVDPDKLRNRNLMRNWSNEKQIFLTIPSLTVMCDRLIKQAIVTYGEPSNPRERTKMEGSAKRVCEKEIQMFLQNIQEVLPDINLLCINEGGDLMSLGDLVSASVLFSNLETLILERCSNMNKLFTLELLKNLQTIQDMRIVSCKGLEALIEESDDETKIGGSGRPQQLSLPKLKHLLLKDLPNLHNLCSNDKVIHTPSLQEIRILKCPKLKRVPLAVDNQHQQFPQMHYLKDEEEWLQSLEWDPPEFKSKIAYFPSFFGHSSNLLFM